MSEQPNIRFMAFDRSQGYTTTQEPSASKHHYWLTIMPFETTSQKKICKRILNSPTKQPYNEPQRIATNKGT